MILFKELDEQHKQQRRRSLKQCPHSESVRRGRSHSSKPPCDNDKHEQHTRTFIVLLRNLIKPAKTNSRKKTAFRVPATVLCLGHASCHAVCMVTGASASRKRHTWRMVSAFLLPNTVMPWTQWKNSLEKKLADSYGGRGGFH